MAAFGTVTPRQVDIVTRVVAAAIALAAIAAFGVLFLVPERTETLFSWTISPTMTARLMGAGYMAGFYLFARITLGIPWRQVRAPVLGLVLFSVLTLAATLLHLDRFHHGQFPFYLWIGLYGFLAVAMLPLWLANEATHGGEPVPGPQAMTPLVRRIATVGGIGSLLLAASLFFLPDLVGPAWPWQLTPLTARALSAWYGTAGVIALVLGTEASWSGWRRGIETGMITLGLILVGTVLSWSEFDPAKPLTWIFLAGTAVSFVGVVLLYVMMERKR